MAVCTLNRIFATMNNNPDRETENSTSSPECLQSENVIIADGDYIDKVAFNLTVNFERMIGRRIPKADTAKWIDCVALDGGIKPNEKATSTQTAVVFIHDKKAERLENFTPGHYRDELHEKAFNDALGEFSMTELPVEDNMVSKHDFFIDVIKTICNMEGVKRVMIIPDAESMYDDVRAALKNVDDEKRITVFAMQPMQGGNFRQEILGYSLMAALGIKGEEIK